jgi:CubicO group peptidase (beta-lactamase class C family)
VEDTLKRWEVPGAAIVVVHGDDTVFLEGFGRRALGQPAKITPDTIFPLASCTKAFTTTLLAMLVDDGVLEWDDLVSKHLSTFKLSDPNANALLTVRDLLCQRTGIAGHDLLWYHAPWNIDEVLKRAQSLPLEYPFRAGFRYSSIPFMAAGRLLEKRTGEKWEKLVRTRICEPLGMTAYFTTQEIPKDADRAAGHRLARNGKVEPMPLWELREPNPSGSIHLSAKDVAAWLKFHLNRGLAPNGERLVSINNLNETKMPHNIIRREGIVKTLNPDTVQLCYALAWIVYDHRGKKVISHGGIYDGFRVQLTMLPDEKLGFAVLCNLHDTRMNAALVNSLIDLYCGLQPRDWNDYFRKIVEDETAERKAELAARNAARDASKKPSLALADYAGEYTQAAYGTLTTKVHNDKLVLLWSSFECQLEPFEGETFRVTDGYFEDQLVVFTVAGGKATGARFISQDFKRK